MTNCDCPPNECFADVGRYLAGDLHAGSILEKKFRPLVWAIICRKLSGTEWRDDRSDCYQTVWLHIFSTLSKWRHECPFCAWVSLLAARGAVTWIRSQPPRSETLLTEPQQPPTTIFEEELECIQITAASFPSELRGVFDLRQQGCNNNEIANRLNKSIRTIQLRVATIRDLLMDCLVE
jgi:RNA polymerase sigma factor (sigma-70 family)